MSNSLKDLAETYRQDIETLTKQIARAKEQLKSSDNVEDILAIRKKIKVYRDMRHELSLMADKLENYYEPEYKPYVSHGTVRMYNGGRRARRLIAGA
jgi:propanediol dehydratase small subunit